MSLNLSGTSLIVDSNLSSSLLSQIQSASGSKNLVINGGMKIWQRGTSFTNSTTTSNFYTADRWGASRTSDVAGMTVSRSSSAPSGFQYSLALQRTAGNSAVNPLNLWYAAETSDSIRFRDNPATLSFYAKTGADYSGGDLSVSLTTSTGSDQRVYSFTGGALQVEDKTLSAIWTRYSMTLSSVPAATNQIGFYFSWSPSGTASADDAVYITGVQLEASLASTSFENRSLRYELAECQRYCLRKSALATNGLALPGGGATLNVRQDFPDSFQAMRVAPVASISASTDFLIHTGGVTNKAATNLQSLATSPNCCWWTTANNSIAAGASCTLYAANANAWLQYNAEL